MFSKVIVAFDGSERARDALLLGEALTNADGELLAAASTTTRLCLRGSTRPSRGSTRRRHGSPCRKPSMSCNAG
jgi:hypothetical protein